MTRTTLLLAALAAALPLTAQAQDATKPVHGYRLTYTLTTTDSGKRVGQDSFAMTVDTAIGTGKFDETHSASGRGQVKIGQKLPVATGTSGDAKSGTQTEFTYLDIGINIDATVTESPSGLLLASKVESSIVAPQPVVIAGVGEPLIRQTVLTNSTTITAGKPTKIGSLDLPDSQRHTDIEVTVDPIS